MQQIDPSVRELDRFPEASNLLARLPNRPNIDLKGFNSGITRFAKVAFCLTSPCNGMELVQVNPYEEVIVMRWGIPQEILRSTGIHRVNPIGLELIRVDTRSYYVDLNEALLNDQRGVPILVTARYSYQVVDPLKAIFQVNNYKKMIHKLAKTALNQIVSRYPYIGKGNEPSLLARSSVFDAELRNNLERAVHSFGIRILYFRLGTMRYEKRMEQLYSAKQAAEAYIKGQQAIAKGSVKIVEETLLALNAQGIKLDEKLKGTLVTHLIFLITQQSSTNVNFFDSNQIPKPLTMQK